MDRQGLKYNKIVPDATYAVQANMDAAAGEYDK